MDQHGVQGGAVAEGKGQGVQLDVCRVQLLDNTHGVCLVDKEYRWFVDTTPQGVASVVRALVRFTASLHSTGMQGASFAYPMPSTCRYRKERVALTLHVHGGITGALFYALAPMVSEADAVAEAEAKALVAFLTRTFLEHYQDSLDQFPTALLIAAKDGGKEAEVQAKFVGAVEAISYHIAKYRGFRSTLRRRAVQAAAAAASARPGSPAAAAASGGLPSGSSAAGAHARSETVAPSVPHRRSASMVPASQLSSGGSEMPPSPSAAGVPHTALNTPKRRTQGKATLDSFRDTESSGSLSGSEQGGGHGAEDGTGADSDSSGLGPGTVPTPQVTPARWHPKRTTGLPEPRSLDFKQEDEVGDGPPAQATARAQAAAPPPVPPTD